MAQASNTPARSTDESESVERPRLLLIDGHSVAYRAFFALPDTLATRTGQVTNAVYGFTSMLINVLRDEQPTHVAVAFDVSRQTFRSEEYPEYKAQREATPETFRGQVPLIKEVLDALGIRHLEMPGFEADDIIATLSLIGEHAGMEVLICSGDRDTMQLVDENVTVLYPRKGVSDLARMTPAAVEEKYLMPPARYPELAALVGEDSDNLPGVPGVGPKTAAKWLTAYEDLEDLLSHADDLKGKAAQNLRDRLDDVRRNRRLNRLRRDLELPVGLADLERRSWTREQIDPTFAALELRTLRDRMLEALPAAEQLPEGGFEVVGQVLHSGEIAGWLTDHRTGRLGVDFAGSWRGGTGDLASVAIADEEGAAAWFDVAELDPEDDRVFAEWLADPEVHLVIHDVKGPLLAIAERGWTLAGVVNDTLLAAYLLRPDQRSFSLADLTVRHLQRELANDTVVVDDSPADQDMLDFGQEEADDGAAEAAMVRARALIDLAPALDAELAEREELELLHDVEIPLARVLAGMERVGIAVDIDHLSSLESDFDAKTQQAAQAAYEVLGKEINLGSPKQLQGVLFDELGMPKTRKTRTGYTTDADALAGLYAKTEHPFLQHLLAHRDAIRLRQTVEGLLKAVADDGRVHTTYLQTIAATGRLSSTDPNLQNIPIRTDEGRRIRQAFVVGAGHEELLTADYSQIEMRLMAHVSADEGLIEAFVSGEDFHTEMASRVFSVDAAEVSPAQRAKIKAMNYGLAYGLSAYGLSQQLGISTGEAKELMEEYFERFGGVRDYLGGVVEEARREGFTATLLGRRRYLPDLMSSNRQRRDMAERAALNAPIQGSAADVIKLAMLAVDRELREGGFASRMLLQVHDELVLEVAAGERAAVEDLLVAQMTSAMDLNVPLDVSVGAGRSWFDAAH
ncbi:DNA polymerase I [Parenemella sanctibonifatiensis]|uniref:DNA polymerase I n=1 Tax=Parenemella sanctibonifatiensis TaxID=2016505 RepID=A0A255EE59_9ACTN|nr:DNA polymerase I [Parenemella sanctibonifatiensis]OYN89847.1 DNA polymerase I [Parenemella sanctibonifatiensis]